MRVLANGAILVQSARYDPTVASYEVYTQACEHVLATRFDAESPGRATVVIDMRLPPGAEAAQYGTWHALSALKHAISALGQHYPGRLDRMVIFPVSTMYHPIVSMATRFVHPESRGKIRLLYDGDDWSAGLESCVPQELLPDDVTWNTWI